MFINCCDWHYTCEYYSSNLVCIYLRTDMTWNFFKMIIDYTILMLQSRRFLIFLLFIWDLMRLMYILWIMTEKKSAANSDSSFNIPFVYVGTEQSYYFSFYQSKSLIPTWFWYPMGGVYNTGCNESQLQVLFFYIFLDD